MLKSHAIVVTEEHGYSTLELRRNSQGNLAFCLVKKLHGKEEIEWLSDDAEFLFFGRKKGHILFINTSGETVILPDNLIFVSDGGYAMLHGKLLGTMFPSGGKIPEHHLPPSQDE